MHLTRDEEKLLESENPTLRKCMEILVALGEVFGAEKLVEIKSAQISGISYDNIGDEGLEWLESFNARVVVKTFSNPAGMDLNRWREMGLEKDFFQKQMRIINALKRIGVEITLTCTPYYLETPSLGDHLAWAESSAVVYANSVIGARTNRESGISALASAVIGKTPYYGLHIKEERSPSVRIIVKRDVEPAIAGFTSGKIVGSEIPLVEFERKVSHEDLKAFGSALAASGGAGMFHAKEITPEWMDFETPSEKIVVDEEEVFDECEPDLIAIGCPHTSAEELKRILEMLSRYGSPKKKLWIFTSRNVALQNAEIVRKIEEFGARVFYDTCMVVSPATSEFDCVMVNSGKALEYLPKLRNVAVTFGTLENCIRRAVK